VVQPHGTAFYTTLLTPVEECSLLFHGAHHWLLYRLVLCTVGTGWSTVRTLCQCCRRLLINSSLACFMCRSLPSSRCLHVSRWMRWRCNCECSVWLTMDSTKRSSDIRTTMRWHALSTSTYVAFFSDLSHFTAFIYVMFNPSVCPVVWTDASARHLARQPLHCKPERRQTRFLQCNFKLKLSHQLNTQYLNLPNNMFRLHKTINFCQASIRILTYKLMTTIKLSATCQYSWLYG